MTAAEAMAVVDCTTQVATKMRSVSRESLGDDAFTRWVRDREVGR